VGVLGFFALAAASLAAAAQGASIGRLLLPFTPLWCALWMDHALSVAIVLGFSLALVGTVANQRAPWSRSSAEQALLWFGPLCASFLGLAGHLGARLDDDERLWLVITAAFACLAFAWGVVAWARSAPAIRLRLGLQLVAQLALYALGVLGLFALG